MEFYDLANRDYMSRKEWTDNGNGNYASVYFRIDTIGFDCVHGWFSEEKDNNLFHSEASEIIKAFGIVEGCGYKQNNEYLHAHPQNISGIVEKSKIKAVAEAINNSKSMTIRWTDVYEEYAIISDEDYAKILEGKRKEMAKYIVENCFTKRTNLFKSRFEIAVNAQEKFKENRLNAREDANNHKMTFQFAQEVIDQLVEKGYLIQVTENETGYIRALNKTEQKKNKVNYDMMEVLI